jgi:hypothetical protein
MSILCFSDALRLSFAGMATWQAPCWLQPRRSSRKVLGMLGTFAQFGLPRRLVSLGKARSDYFLRSPKEHRPLNRRPPLFSPVQRLLTGRCTMGAVIRLLLLQYGPQVTSPAVTDEPRPMATVVEEFHGLTNQNSFSAATSICKRFSPQRLRYRS